MPLIPLRGDASQRDYPLLQARVHYELTDVYLSARLTQTYKSEASVPTQVKYVFPLPPSSSVYAFEAVIDRTRVIKGVAKEKKQAKEEYEEAIRQGKTAALLDQKTDEVFEMSLGNIQPKSVIDVNVSLLSIVEHDGTLDTVRLTFPTSIAPHYGHAPTSVTTTAPVVDLTLAVTASAPIQSVKSTSHPIETIMGRKTDVDTADFNPSLARVKLSSTQFLQTDVVIVIQCKGLDRPRCTVESFSPADGAEEHTEAYALTVVPRFDSAVIPSQEYIFLVDRSGSMAGGKMAAVRSALKVILASLPTTGTTFNIVSFGSRHDSLWPSSKPYNTKTVKDALRHVNQMDANYGGTEIAEAIEAAVALRKAEAGVPASIFVLTDGEAWDLDQVSAGVQKHVQAGESAQSQVKFFCMGIGNSPSKALVDAIARAGNGVSLFVREDEGPTAKLITLLRAARSKPVENLKVDWGVDADHHSSTANNHEDFELVPPYSSENVPTNPPGPQPMSLFDESTTASGQGDQLGPADPPAVILAPPPRLQQAPSLDSLPPLYAGFRFSVFAIVRRDPKSNSSSQPRRVRISGMAGDQPVSFEVPIYVHSASQPSEVGAKFLHVLAARALIRKFEDHKPMSETDKAEVLRLAVRYGLSSSQTSFVAVEENPGPDTMPSGSPETTDPSIAASESEASSEEDGDKDEEVRMAPAFRQSFRVAGSAVHRHSSTFGAAPMPLIMALPSGSGTQPGSAFDSISFKSTRQWGASPQISAARKSSTRRSRPKANSYTSPLSGGGRVEQVAMKDMGLPKSGFGSLVKKMRKSSIGPITSIAASASMITSVSSSQVESDPEDRNEGDVPASATGLAQLQRIDGAFLPSKRVYALVGGDAARKRFRALSSPSAVSAADLAEPDESPAKGVGKRMDGAKARTGGLRRMMNPFRRASASAPSKGSKASEGKDEERGEEEEPSEWDAMETLWTTLLVLAYLEAKLADEADAWALMAEKAREWIAATVGSLPPTSAGAEGGDVAMLVQTMEAEAKKVVEEL